MQPDLERFLTDRLDEITAEVVREINVRVPAYAHVRAGAVGTLVRDAVSAYLGARDKTAVLDAFRVLGAGEARAGHDVRHFETAMRTGARVIVRRTANAAAHLYPPTAEYITVMETAFSAEDELVKAAVDGARTTAGITVKGA
ncbi:hypothetical protein E1200_20455 [Actinomadura sp. GC306]|uniref:hypothetical protein n=1 Tax=Actinomadura sp. GC306 TaxID=2530367 RepID=UPI00104884D8|nr:hypothetical protein [Actinomadura sp. GC306]TDC64358.1 hypothetical protein E1200_20455 [Actinomadura sp. GC306]